MRKKSLICLVCLLALLLGCVGCGETSAEETAVNLTQEDKAGETLRVPPESFGGEKTPNRPDGEKPAEGEKAEKPAEGEKAEKPAEGEKAEKPAEGEKTEKSAEGEKTEKSAEGEKEKPSDGEKKSDGENKSDETKKNGSDGKSNASKSGDKSKWKGKGKWSGKGKRSQKMKKTEESQKEKQTAESSEKEESASESKGNTSDKKADNKSRKKAKESDAPDADKSEKTPAKTATLPYLDGAWEPRDHIGPRVEINGSRLTRLWRGSPVLVTEFDLTQDGQRFVLKLRENELKYVGENKPYATVKSCVYEKGAITFTDDFPITGESSDTLYPTTNSRYGDVTDVSYAVLPQLAGRWVQDDGECTLEFSGNSMTYGFGNHVDGSAKIIVVKNNGDGVVRVVDVDPASETVGMFNELTLDTDALSAAVHVADAAAVKMRFHREPIAPGGSSDYTDYYAPKTISDTQIRDFSCTISLLSFSLPDEEELTSPRYELYAKREGDTVSCRRVSKQGDELFAADAAFLEELQEIVEAYDFAQFNGHDCVTHGLPDDFGASLRILYDSEEKIYASDNQQMFLPMDAVRELVELFFEKPAEETKETELAPKPSPEPAAAQAFDIPAETQAAQTPSEAPASQEPAEKPAAQKSEEKPKETKSGKRPRRKKKTAEKPAE